MTFYTQSFRSCIVVLAILLGCQIAYATIKIGKVKSISSPGACDGRIEVIADGDAGPFTVSISGAGGYSDKVEEVEGQQYFIGLCAGKYSIVVSNKYGCEKALEATIACPLQVVTTTTPVSNGGGCDGSITLTAEGTAGPFLVNVIGATNRQIETVNGTIVISGLCGGDYEVAITNAYGCVKVINTFITQCSSISVPNVNQFIQQPSYCGGNDGSMELKE